MASASHGSFDAWGGIKGPEGTLLEDGMVSRSSTSSSCAVTELDSPTGDSDLDLLRVDAEEAKVVEVIIIDDDAATVPLGHDGLCHWRGLTNMEFHIATVAQDRRISWRLPNVTNYCSISHGVDVVRSVLALGVKRFKIGLTAMPYHRWANPRYGYLSEGYSGLILTYVFENSDHSAEMETALIALYRVWDVLGNRVGCPGNPMCANRSPGGESAHHHHSPHFVYVVYQLNIDM